MKSANNVLHNKIHLNCLVLNRCRIFVVTAQCLVEAVERKEVTLSQFSLMVLDECHHTRGGHPFKQLMNQYMEVMLGSPAGRSTLPQVNNTRTPEV